MKTQKNFQESKIMTGNSSKLQEEIKSLKRIPKSGQANENS